VAHQRGVDWGGEPAAWFGGVAAASATLAALVAQPGKTLRGWGQSHEGQVFLIVRNDGEPAAFKANVFHYFNDHGVRQGRQEWTIPWDDKRIDPKILYGDGDKDSLDLARFYWWGRGDPMPCR